MKRYFVILLVLISIVAIFTACVSPFEMREVGGKVVTNCYGNLIPCANNTYTLGDITHLWSNIYSTNINASSVNVNGNIIVSGTVDGVDVSTIAGSSHAKLHVITSILDHSSTATPNQILKADANGLPVNATNTDAQVSSAVTNSHVQNTDWVLLNAVGGANLISSGTLKNNLAVDPGVTIDGVDISTHEALTAAHGATGAVVGTTNNQTLDNKTLASPTVTGNITMSTASATVDGVDVSAHASRHQWNGADQINIKDSLIVGLRGIHVLNPTSVSTSVTGGRGWAYASDFAGANTGSGTLTNDITGLWCWVGLWLDGGASPNDTQNIRFSVRPQVCSSTNKMEAWWGMFEAAVMSTYPTSTAKHIGWQLVESAGAGDGHAKLYATVANGTTETKVDISSFDMTDWGLWSQYDLSFWYRDIGGVPGVYFYTNGILVATITTNVPSGWGAVYGQWTKNLENSSEKTILIYTIRMIQAGVN